MTCYLGIRDVKILQLAPGNEFYQQTEIITSQQQPRLILIWQPADRQQSLG